MADEKTPTPIKIPRSTSLREMIKRGYQPIAPQNGHQPSTKQEAPSNPPNRGTSGKK